MVTRPAFFFACLGALAMMGACQLVAGTQDKQLDPALNGGASDASSDALDALDSLDASDSPPDATSEEAAVYERTPPPRPDGSQANDSDASLLGAHTFAARRFYFGTIDPETDATTFEAWRKLGYDIDGFCTTKEQSNTDTSGVCKRRPGASQICQEDGDQCRDNAAGHLLAEVTPLLSTDFERSVHVRTTSGDTATLIIQLLDLDDGPDDPWVPARVYVTAPTASPPLWDGTDELSVDVDSLIDAGLDTPKHEMVGYMKDHIWVSGDFNQSPRILPMMVLDQIVELQTLTSTLTLTLDPTHKQVLSSTLSAVFEIEDLEPILMRGMLLVTECKQDAAQQLMDSYFLPNRDLVAGGTNFVDPDATCDVMSIGTQIEWLPVQAPTRTTTVQPLPNPCDGG